MRKLVSVQRVREIKPLAGYDRIVQATIEGWHVIVAKDEFKNGDLCVFAEIDTILPRENPNFEFLEGKRIKTMRFRTFVSQGCAFPLSVLPKGDYKEGDDVTDLVRAKKYEPFIMDTEGLPFPSWIEKSDETRVQVLQPWLTKYKGTLCNVTEKLDGTSITAWLDDRLHVCSRNLEIKNIEDFRYITAEKKILPLLKSMPLTTVVQGELVGPKIQKNKYKFEDYYIFIFNVFDKVGNVIEVKDTPKGVEFVPNLGTIELSDDIDALVEMAKGKSVINPKSEREGIVIRPVKPIVAEDDAFVRNYLSFKVINPDFLLKYDE